MAIETMIVLAILVLIILVTVITPFLTKHAGENIDIDNTLNLEREKERIFILLSDLEYDYQMGKIAENDYHQIKAELTGKAAVLMSNSLIDIDFIEQEVDEEINKYLSNAVYGEGRANEG